MECTRCGNDIEFTDFASDGKPLYKGMDGWLTCSDFLRWDSEGVYRQLHTLEDPDDQ